MISSALMKKAGVMTQHPEITAHTKEKMVDKMNVMRKTGTIRVEDADEDVNLEGKRDSRAFGDTGRRRCPVNKKRSLRSRIPDGS